MIHGTENESIKIIEIDMKQRSTEEIAREAAMQIIKAVDMIALERKKKEVNGIWDKEQEGTWGLGGWWTEELLTRQQTLQALTINGARQLFLEEERGSIKEGKYADFLLIDQDVLTCDVGKIRDTKVVNTYFEGKRVYPAE